MSLLGCKPGEDKAFILVCISNTYHSASHTESIQCVLNKQMNAWKIELSPLSSTNFFNNWETLRDLG